jgi:hypothetical protein
MCSKAPIGNNPKPHMGTYAIMRFYPIASSVTLYYRELGTA